MTNNYVLFLPQHGGLKRVDFKITFWYGIYTNYHLCLTYGLVNGEWIK
jgi:hypothetical protein